MPQLFEDAGPPRYRRRAAIVVGVVALMCLAGLSYPVQRYGLAGMAQRAGHISVIVLRAFANAVS